VVHFALDQAVWELGLLDHNTDESGMKADHASPSWDGLAQRPSGRGNTQFARARRVAGPFDLSSAPIAGGRFLGDYVGLAAVGSKFAAIYVGTRPATPNTTFVAERQMSG
jgi:hypothetical protein